MTVLLVRRYGRSATRYPGTPSRTRLHPAPTGDFLVLFLANPDSFDTSKYSLDLRRLAENANASEVFGRLATNLSARSLCWQAGASLRWELARLHAREGRAALAIPELEAIAQRLPPGIDRADWKQELRRAQMVVGAKRLPVDRLRLANGTERSLKDAPLWVIQMFETGCEMCGESVRELHALRREFPREQLGLVSLALDRSRRAVRRWCDGHGIDWDVGLDREQSRRLFPLIPADGVPVFLVADGSGTILAVHSGTAGAIAVKRFVRSRLGSRAR